MQPLSFYPQAFFVRATKESLRREENRRIAGRGADTGTGTGTDADTDADTGTRQDHGAGGEVCVYPAYQIRRYAWSNDIAISILTEFEEFSVYYCRSRPSKDDKSTKSRLLYFRLPCNSGVKAKHPSLFFSTTTKKRLTLDLALIISLDRLFSAEEFMQQTVPFKSNYPLPIVWSGLRLAHVGGPAFSCAPFLHAGPLARLLASARACVCGTSGPGALRGQFGRAGEQFAVR